MTGSPERIREYGRNYRARKTAQGQCVCCGCYAPRKESHTMCEMHLAEMRERARERNRSRKAAGLCVLCGIKPAKGTVACLECRPKLWRLAHPEKPPRRLEMQNRAIRQERERAVAEKDQIERRREALEALHSEDWSDLPQRTVDMIEAYYGLRSGKPRPLLDIGNDYGLTRERVRQIIKPFKEVAQVLGLNRMKTERVVMSDEAFAELKEAMEEALEYEREHRT